MATPVIMPMLGLTMEEGAVAEWLKREGDEVKKDEPLFTVEMDKGIVEVPAPASGTLLRITVSTGQTVSVKTVIAEIGEPALSPGPTRTANADEGRREGSASPSADRLFASPRARRRARERGVSLSDITGSGPNGRIVEEDVLAMVTGRVSVTPLARKLAAEHGLELAGVAGSGPGGRVTQDDVLGAAGAGGFPHLASPIAMGEGQIEPLSRIRSVTAERLGESAHSVARVTLHLEADMTEASNFRQQLAPELARLGVAKLPWDAILAKAAALALMEHPAVNAQWVEGQGIRRNSGANVGVAVALEPEGLVVPVLTNAHTKSLRQLAGELLALVDKVRAGRLSATEMQGGTVTITNLGAYRIDGFTPIINPPETAILGVGRIAEKPGVVDHHVEIRQMCTLSLSFDHRVVDGVPAAAFLRRLAELLERPYALLEI
ncbi:MAG: dihydrolipoamide acetyltransferase family protein [Chloroflexota bacterium]